MSKYDPKPTANVSSMGKHKLKDNDFSRHLADMLLGIKTYNYQDRPNKSSNSTNSQKNKGGKK